MRQLFWVSLLGLAASGCESQVTEDYRGDRLVEVNGSLASYQGLLPDDVEIGVIWFHDRAIERPDGSLETERERGELSVAVYGDLYARFGLEVYEPPPDEALTPSEKIDPPLRAMFGYLVAGPRGLPASDPIIETNPFEGTYGVANRFLLYVDRDILEGEPAAQRSGPLSAGYHLVRFGGPSAEDVEARTRCVQSRNAGDCEEPRERLVPIDADESIELRFSVLPPEVVVGL